MQLWSSYTTRDKEINLHQPKKELVLWLRTVKCIFYLQVNVFYQRHYTKNFFCTGKAAIRLHYSSHLAAGIWGATEMLASSDPGMDLAGATEHCSSSISFRMGGGGGCTHSTSCSWWIDIEPVSHCTTVPEKIVRMWDKRRARMCTPWREIQYLGKRGEDKRTDSQPVYCIHTHKHLPAKTHTQMKPHTHTYTCTHTEQLSILTDPSTLTSEGIRKIISTG